MPPCNGKCVLCTALNDSCKYALYFCFCNKGSLCSFRLLKNFLDEDSFLCSLATKLRHTQEWIICLRSAKTPRVSPQTNVVIKEEFTIITVEKINLYSL